MRLRRVIEHVRAQNWTAVFLDFVIVVIGVFIGIQVANWNNARADREREAQYLEKLEDDIGEEIVVLEEVRHTLRIRNSVIGELYKEALGQSLPSEVKTSLIVSGIASEGDFSMPEPINLDPLDRNNFLSYAVFARICTEQNSTFETLQATGDFGLIRSQALAYGIADYYTSIGNLKRLEDGTLRRTRDDAAAIAKRHGLNPFGPNDYELVLSAIRNDAELAASLRALRNLSATNYALATHANEEAISILGKLKEADE